MNLFEFDLKSKGKTGLFDVIDDPPVRYGFIIICSDSAACYCCEKLYYF